MRTMPLDEQNGNPASRSRFAAGLFWGAAVGATVALLFAPTSGRRLRRQIGASTDRLALRAKNWYEDASETVHDLAARSRKAIGG